MTSESGSALNSERICRYCAEFTAEAISIKSTWMLSELVPGRQYRQLNLFGSMSTAEKNIKSTKMMNIIDQINARMKRGTIKLTSEGFKQPWKMKQGNKSPSYTTKWEELVCM